MMINYCCQISLGMLFHDENTTDGITKVIEHRHYPGNQLKVARIPIIVATKVPH